MILTGFDKMIESCIKLFFQIYVNVYVEMVNFFIYQALIDISFLGINRNWKSLSLD